MKTILLRVLAVLNDTVLGFLALLAAELALAPAVFELAPGAVRTLDALQWLIIVAFAVEYLGSLLLAEQKGRFVLNPWRLLDLVIIFGPLVSLLPQVSDALRSTPVLRLLRLLRLVSFAARASGVVVREQVRRQAAAAQGPPEVSLLKPGAAPQLRRASWEDFVRWASDPQGDWCHVSNVSPAQFDALARVEGLSRALLESCLSEANYPRLEATARGLALSLWLPTTRVAARVEVERAAVLLVSSPHALLTVAPHACDLPALLAGRLKPDFLPAAPFAVRLPLALLKLVLERNEDVAGRLEQQLRALEDVPVSDSRPGFFELAFRLRKELTAAKSDLWRVKGLLATLAEGRVHLPGGGAEGQEFLRVLADQADYLYETVDNLREGLLSVIELHLNVVSFEMNKFMRLLAVVSVLGLIPAVVGGLLGMNLAGNPWPATLSQVTYGVCAAILLCLYVFLVRGWLR